MKIGINGYEAVVPRFGFNVKTGLPNRAGSTEYVYQLLQELSKTDKLNQYIIYLPCLPTSDLPTETENWKYKVIPRQIFWTLFALSYELIFHSSHLDVFFSPTHYLPLYCPYPNVISVMDLSYLHFPQLFKPKDLWQLRLWTKWSVGQAKKVLTISQASKNDIIKEYKLAADKVVVTYLGAKL